MITQDWEAPCSPHREDINSLTDCITYYIDFCVENTVPSRKVQCFPQNNPWLKSGIKTLGDKKNRFFSSEDKEQLRRTRTTAPEGAQERNKEEENGFKRKLEQQPEQNNTRDIWRGLKNNLVMEKVKGKSKTVETRTGQIFSIIIIFF